MVWRLLIGFWLLYATPTGAQTTDVLTVDPDYTPQRLIGEVFVANRCATITNVRAIGDHPAAMGYFRDPESATGFREGVLLSTGRVADAVGPNTLTNTATAFGDLPTGDADLGLITSRDLYDRSGIEFDFVPLEPTVTFRYVFASEEYCEYVDNVYNDIFGFFVSGPGFDGPYEGGAENVATVPGSRRPVSISTINHRRNQALYLDNELPNIRQSAGCGGGAVPGPRFQQVEYDGQTVVLTVTLRVQACATYHIRLVIADVGDADLDSAVFLEAGSFDTGGGATLENALTNDRAPIRLFEGCGPQDVRVRRAQGADPNREQTVNYRISSRSVASDSLDFLAGSGTVVIPPGEAFVDLPLIAPGDSLPEGPESAWLVLDSPCGCFADSIELVIDEPSVPELVRPGTIDRCGGPDGVLSARLRGGVPPYRYDWSFGSTLAYPPVPDPSPDSVSLVVTDACDQTVRFRASLAPAPAPGITLLPLPADSCGADTVGLQFDLTGTAPFTLRYRYGDGVASSVDFPTAGRHTWPLTREGDYQLQLLTDAICARELDTTVQINLTPPLAPIEFDCARLRRTPLRPQARGGRPPYTYSIDGGPFRSEEIWDSLPPGRTYRLRIRDGIGCEIVQDDFFFPAADRFPVRLPNPIQVERGETVRLQPELRVPPAQIATYRWQPAEGLSCTDCAEPELTTGRSRSIGLTVTDVLGCSQQVTAEIVVTGPPPYYVPTAFSPDGDGVNDEFRVFGGEGQVASVDYLRVFDRWGGLVWEAADDSAWDGRYRGRAAPSGIYVWAAGVRLTDGRLSERQGTVMLLPR
jgi:gliding motility-associated-like protein